MKLLPVRHFDDELPSKDIVTPATVKKLLPILVHFYDYLSASYEQYPEPMMDTLCSTIEHLANENNLFNILTPRTLPLPSTRIRDHDQPFVPETQRLRIRRSTESIRMSPSTSDNNDSEEVIDESSSNELPNTASSQPIERNFNYAKTGQEIVKRKMNSLTGYISDDTA